MPQYAARRDRIAQTLADTRAAILRTRERLARTRERLHALTVVLQPQRARRDREAGGYFPRSPRRTVPRGRAALPVRASTYREYTSDNCLV
jgi:hypothetical protein